MKNHEEKEIGKVIEEINGKNREYWETKNDGRLFSKKFEWQNVLIGYDVIVNFYYLKFSIYFL